MEFYSQACDMFIKPPRAEYFPEDLGEKYFHLGNKSYYRNDLELKNPRGYKLQCSHFQPSENQRPQPLLPCMIYLHGSGGCRLEALETIDLLLRHSITVFCFDFAGSGLSEGDHISLGYYERDDVATVVKYLQGSGTVSRIGLWGRSMGGATSLMYTSDHPNDVHCLIIDSAFSSLKLLAKEVADNLQINLPKIFLSGMINLGLGLIRKTILRKAHFDIRKVEPKESAQNCTKPVIFVHGEGDTFVHPHHSQTLFDSYCGSNKRSMFVKGGHNCLRPASFLNEVCAFITENLLTPQERSDFAPFPKGVIGNTANTTEGQCFFCKQIPYGEDFSHVSALHANVLLSVKDTGLKILRPFSEVLISECKYSALKGYWSNQNHFFFKWKAPINKNSDWTVVFYTVQAIEIVQAIDEQIHKRLCTDMSISLGELLHLIVREKHKQLTLKTQTHVQQAQQVQYNQGAQTTNTINQTSNTATNESETWTGAHTTKPRSYTVQVQCPPLSLSAPSSPPSSAISTLTSHSARKSPPSVSQASLLSSSQRGNKESIPSIRPRKVSFPILNPRGLHSLRLRKRGSVGRTQDTISLAREVAAAVLKCIPINGESVVSPGRLDICENSNEEIDDFNVSAENNNKEEEESSTSSEDSARLIPSASSEFLAGKLGPRPTRSMIYPYGFLGNSRRLSSQRLTSQSYSTVSLPRSIFMSYEPTHFELKDATIEAAPPLISLSAVSQEKLIDDSSVT